MLTERFLELVRLVRLDQWKKTYNIASSSQWADLGVLTDSGRNFCETG